MNNDDLKTKEKCMKVCRESLNDGKSVVIDNTNPTADVRQRYIDIAKEFKVPVRALFFDVTKELCMHNNVQRKNNNHHKHLSKAVPSIPIHSFFKNHTVPAVAEGFESIITINFVPDCFHSDEDKEHYNRTLIN